MDVPRLLPVDTWAGRRPSSVDMVPIRRHDVVSVPQYVGVEAPFLSVAEGRRLRDETGHAPSRGGRAVEGPGGRIALVLVLVVGGAVWIFTTSPGYALLALLVGLALWEYGRRSRYRRHLRFVLAPHPRPRPAGLGHATTTVPPRRSPTGGRRPPWTQAPAWKSAPRGFATARRQAPPRSKPITRGSPPRRPG